MSSAILSKRKSTTRNTDSIATEPKMYHQKEFQKLNLPSYKEILNSINTNILSGGGKGKSKNLSNKSF